MIPDESSLYLTLDVYLPRYICALLLGIDLALSGFLMQILTKNRLADTKLMGVSSGGLVAVAILSSLNITLGHALYYPIVFIGCAISSVLLFYMSLKSNGRPIFLLLGGIGISSLLYSLAISIFILNHEDLLSVYAWTTGSLNHVNWFHVLLLFIVTCIGSFLVYLISPSLKIYELGRNTALSLGLAHGRYSFYLIFLITALVSVSVCVAGSIGFVGLLVPNVARFVFQQNYKNVVISCIFIGGVLLVICQFITSFLSVYHEIPVGCMTAILGAFYLLGRNLKWAR